MIKEILNNGKVLVICDSCNHEYINSHSLAKKNNPRSCPKCRNKGKLCYWHGKTHTKETRKKLSKSHIGQESWIKGKTHTKETRKKLSKSHIGQKAWNKGKKLSPEHCTNLSKSHIGIPVSEKTKEKLRNINIKIAESRCNASNQSFPNRGLKEIDVVDNYLSPISPYHIHIGYRVCGYMVDGYIKELNLAIEFDETSNHSYPGQIKRDKIRQKRIEKKISCEFLRIKESDWDRDKKTIIQEFKRRVYNDK